MEMLTMSLSHLFVTVFLYSFSIFMVVPAMVDVIMSAVCPGKDVRSMAIYLAGAQNVIVGLGTLVMLPLIGKLSDTYGRKLMLTAPMVLAIFPSVILAYSRSPYYVYAYLLIKTVISMLCDGSVFCIALAYVAENIPENQRASAFGILSGVASCAFLFGNLFTRFISTSSTFQVSAAGIVIAVAYTGIFLPESVPGVGIAGTGNKTENESLLEKDPSENPRFFKKMSAFHDTISLLTTSSTFSQAAAIAFFNTLGDAGLDTSLLIFLYSTAWSSWVNYVAAMVTVLSAMGSPCVRSIASKQVGPSEQVT